MRGFVLAVMICVLISVGVGCMLPAYSPNPQRRTTQLLWTSEDLRLLEDEWERFWMLDMPSHTTPWRTHGGII